jgi:hypothetical protein
MASATGIPEEHPDTIEHTEDEPLLGNRGAVVQGSKPIYHNFLTGKDISLRARTLMAEF